MQECCTYESCCILHVRLGQNFFSPPSFTPSIFIIAFIASQLGWKSEMTLKLPFIPHFLIFSFHPRLQSSSLAFFNDQKQKIGKYKTASLVELQKTLFFCLLFTAFCNVFSFTSLIKRVLCRSCLEVNKLASVRLRGQSEHRLPACRH